MLMVVIAMSALNAIKQPRDDNYEDDNISEDRV